MHPEINLLKLSPRYREDRVFFTLAWQECCVFPIHHMEKCRLLRHSERMIISHMNLLDNMEEVHLSHTFALTTEDAALWLAPSCPKSRLVDQSLQ